MPSEPRAGLPIAPTLCGLNLWLVGLVVPLALALSSGQPLTALVVPLVLSPLSPLSLLVGLWLRARRLGQALLVVAVPLFALSPAGDVALSSPRLWPRPAVLIELALLIAYLLLVCRLLARETSPLGAASDLLLPARPWQHELVSQIDQLPPPSVRLRRRLWMGWLLCLVVVLVPALWIYALDFHLPHLRALQKSFPNPLRQSAVQASVTALLALLSCVTFYFCIAAPQLSQLTQHRELRDELRAVRSRARRGRPSLRLWLAMGLAIVGMGTLLLWTLRGQGSL
jgi:hypothetical protein